ncbi:secretion protein [Photobacterium kishitanii]|uniref:Protein Syd n=1 Tax=Photobacterium kishitanii TaxID=318456 RepID=A0AAX0YPT4_9GAMM|nr:SecY-interacting protein [Photobacterium kishitanii]KJG55580.1 secretion protein [Photobacterium kishitanii]KJG60132.1 secretion protein [Photobacterium kishitanii]KJG63826.1 secretion protein [Photobacterium kishitanii]KJG67081.1 secretion protein [Photobacterium kishitanii]OBU30425.1 SecY-interacting protein [Photobacterium kishitanii]
MNHPVTCALSDFSARYLQAWCDADRGFPVSEHLVGLISPCVVDDDGRNVTWKPIERQPMITLDGVEKGMDLSLHSDINAFYGSQFSGDMSAMFGDLSLDLLQAFNDDDIDRLQQNILGHLVTQRRMKLKPTVFIAVLDDESKVISICNLTGQVVLETLGKDIRQVLAADVTTFLQQLQPLVTEV